MPDEALPEEEVDVISLLAEQGRKDEDMDTDEEELSEDELSSLPEKAREIIENIRAKKNKTIRKRTEAQHRTQKELDALAEANRKMAEELESMRQGKSAEPGQEPPGIDPEEWKNRIEDDSTAVIDYVGKVQEAQNQRLAEFLQSEFSKIYDAIGGLKSATDPERAKYRDKIEVLSKDPRFSGLDENALIAVAKAMSEVKVPARGTVAGRRIVKKPERKPDYGGLSLEELQRKMGFNLRGK